MTRILCTFPGQIGDLLWSLPTARALAEAYGTPVDFALPQRYAGLCDLLQAQDYIRVAWALERWDVQLTAPMGPRVPPPGVLEGIGRYARVYHLGYEGWPEPTLAEDIWQRAAAQHLEAHGLHVLPLDLDEPWITAPESLFCPDPPYVWVGWSEEWIELKVGVLLALANRFPRVTFLWVRPYGGRYDEFLEVLPRNVHMATAGWPRTAQIGSVADCYLGCLSSQWVLANALGQRCVVMEPGEARHHPTFWRESSRNVLVRGNDGRWTFDSRHCGDVLEEVLRGTDH